LLEIDIASYDLLVVRPAFGIDTEIVECRLRVKAVRQKPMVDHDIGKKVSQNSQLVDHLIGKARPLMQSLKLDKM